MIKASYVTDIDYITEELTKTHEPSYLSFADEPDFQYSVLRDSVPLTLSDEKYYPLIAEFPSSPGIDLIYFSKNGQLLLVEMKHKTYSSFNAQAEIIYQAARYKSHTVEDLIEYAGSHSKDCNKTNLLQFREVFHGKNQLKIAELITSDHCHLGCLFYGKINVLNNEDIYVNLFGIKYGNGHLLQDHIEATMPQEAHPELARSYEQKLSKGRTAQRSCWKNSEVVKILQDSENYLIRSVYILATSKGYDINPGSGRQWSCSIKFSVSSSKSFTIMTVNEDRISIPGNLYYQSRYFKTDRTSVDRLMNEVKSLFSSDKLTITNGLELKIPCNSNAITPENVASFLSLMSEFTDAC